MLQAGASLGLPYSSATLSPTSNIYYFLPSFGLGIIHCSFTNSLGIRLGCLFEVFLASYGRPVLLDTPLLGLLLLNLKGLGPLCFHFHFFQITFLKVYLF